MHQTRVILESYKHYANACAASNNAETELDKMDLCDFPNCKTFCDQMMLEKKLGKSEKEGFKPKVELKFDNNQNVVHTDVDEEYTKHASDKVTEELNQREIVINGYDEVGKPTEQKFEVIQDNIKNGAKIVSNIVNGPNVNHSHKSDGNINEDEFNDIVSTLDPNTERVLTNSNRDLSLEENLFVGDDKNENHGDCVHQESLDEYGENDQFVNSETADIDLTEPVLKKHLLNSFKKKLATRSLSTDRLVVKNKNSEVVGIKVEIESKPEVFHARPRSHFFHW